MLVAPLITWLFVRTSPDDVMTTPVPAAAPLPKPSTVSMSTTPGLTLAAITAGSEEAAPLGIVAGVGGGEAAAGGGGAGPLGIVAVLVGGEAAGAVAGAVVGVDVAGADAVEVTLD